MVAIEISAAMPRDLLMKMETRSPHSGPNSHALEESGVRTDTRIEPNTIRPHVLDDQRNAEREDELCVVAFALELGARAADTRDQGLMDEIADTEQHRPGQECGNIGADERSERRPARRTP